jgi:hypothetical protein
VQSFNDGHCRATAKLSKMIFFPKALDIMLLLWFSIVNVGEIFAKGVMHGLNFIGSVYLKNAAKCGKEFKRFPSLFLSMPGKRNKMLIN